MPVKIVVQTNNIPDVKAALERSKESILKECGQVAIAHAVNNIVSQKKHPGTGDLEGSLEAIVDGDDVIVGTNLEYAPYVEFGTGIYAEKGSGAKKIPWVYYNEAIDSFVTTYGSRPAPYLRPAFKDHLDDYRNIIEKGLKNG